MNVHGKCKGLGGGGGGVCVCVCVFLHVLIACWQYV